MFNTNLIKATFETKIKQKALAVHKYESTWNNHVYKIETESRPYIFKIYTNKCWPEDGKTLFVNRKLREYGIACAEVFVFNREDENFLNGYLIEECLSGTTADTLNLTESETKKIFKKLGGLVSRVHEIKMHNFGYTGDGSSAEWDSFSECMLDCIDQSGGIEANNLFNSDELEAIGQEIRKRLEVCDKLPSVLTHGDLSLKNILIDSVDSNSITLIDWDGVHSLCWVADVARFTFWLKMYGAEKAVIYRNAFLNAYKTKHDKNLYYEVEDILHVWYGLDNISFLYGKPKYESAKSLLNESLEKCGMGKYKCK